MPVSTLAALALQAPADSGLPILAAIDARMGELYLGLFRRDPERLVVALGGEWMATPSQPAVSADLSSMIGIGSGLAAADGALVAALGAQLLGADASALPHAADVARLAALAMGRGEAIRADLLEPAYLRDKVALTLDEQAAARRLR